MEAAVLESMKDQGNATENKPVSERVARRRVLTSFFAALTTALAGLLPPLAGLGVFLDPLRRRAAAGKSVRVTTLDALPNDGLPHRFPVIADRSDAWNRFPKVPIGAVYLRRAGKAAVEALNVVCPHAGCFVEYFPEEGNYRCPCHNSSFKLDGGLLSPGSPSPRGLDVLEVELRHGSEIWVKFQNFKTGRREKIPVS